MAEKNFEKKFEKNFGTVENNWVVIDFSPELNRVIIYLHRQILAD